MSLSGYYLIPYRATSCYPYTIDFSRIGKWERELGLDRREYSRVTRRERELGLDRREYSHVKGA